MLLVVALSAALQPHMWVEWLRFLVGHSGDGTWRFVQIPLALTLAGYAARKDHPALLVVAWWLSMPTATPLFMQAWAALAPLARTSRKGRARSSLVGASVPVADPTR